MPAGIVFGEHPEPLTLKMTLGFEWTGTARRLDSDGVAVAWSGPTVLEFAADVTDVTGVVDGTDVTFTVPVESVALLHAADDYAVRVTDAGELVGAGRISWLPRSGWDGEPRRVQSFAFVTAGPPGPTAVSTDAGNAATLGSDSLIYVGEEQIETAVEDYLTANPPAAAPDADATTKGILRLTGDLGGTADSPTVPGLAGKANTSHTHVTSDVTGLDAALSGKAATSHTHVIADTTGLQTALDGKAASSHTHTLANITDAGGAAALDVGTTVGTVAAGDDARLSDARTPTAHTHDVDDIDATGTADSTTYLRGDGTWATPAGGGGGVTDHGDLTGLGEDDHTQYALADGSRGSFAAPLGADDNYVTDAEKAALHSHANKTALDNVSGVNTGDQDLSGYATTASLGDSATLDVGTTAETVAAGDHDHTGVYQPAGSYAAASHTHELDDLDATGATDGHVLTADGAGGAAWEAPSGGGSDPWTYAVTSSDWTCPDTNTYTNIPDLSIPSGLAAGVYEVRVQVVSKGSNAHHWSIGKPSGGSVYTMARAGRGAGETRFANWTAAGGNGTIEVDSHPNGTWGAIAFECTSTLVVASATTTALTVMLRSTSGATHTAMSGSFITWRKIA